MKTLAIDIATDAGSVALLEGRDLVFERQWVENLAERQGLFVLLQALAGGGALVLAEVDDFVVGVGPGSFAGLRMAVSAACGLAEPGGKRVTGISSAEAVAWEVMAGSDVDEVVVWGDARRNELWAMRFGRGSQWPERRSGLMVGGFDEIPGDWARGKALWVTADWGRIGSRLKAMSLPDVGLIERCMVPKARHIGWLGVVKWEAGVSTEPLVPVYVHPAVAAPGTKGKPVEHKEMKGTS